VSFVTFSYAASNGTPTGYTNTFTNIGLMEGDGFEFDLDYMLLETLIVDSTGI
jgi:hypothetical protein